MSERANRLWQSLRRKAHAFAWYWRKAWTWHLPNDGFRAAWSYWWAHRRYWFGG